MKEASEGIWREIVCADHIPQRNMVILGLNCGHRVSIRVDTAFGKSFMQTEWRSVQCYQCHTAYGTGKYVTGV